MQDTTTHRMPLAGAPLPPGAAEGERAWEVPVPQWPRRIVKILLLASVLLVPILHLPLTPDPLFAKVTLAELAALAGVAIWLVTVFTEKRVTYLSSPINVGLLAVALAVTLSLLLSQDRFGSLFGPDQTGETAAATYSFLIFAFLIPALATRWDLRRLSGALLAAFALATVPVFVSIFGGLVAPAFLQVNPVGTVNALSIVLAAGFAYSFWLLALGDGTVGRLAVVGAWLTALLTFGALILLNSRVAWVGIAAVTAILAALVLSKHRWGAMPRYRLAIAFAVLVVGLVMVFRPPAFPGRFFTPPLEISPSFTATVKIAGQVLGRGEVFGSGPATFLVDFNRYRDRALNLTNAWALRFSHGFSFLTTVAATLGLAGLLAFLWLLVAFLRSLFRVLARAERIPAALGSTVAALVLLAVAWFTYASSFTSNFLFFILLGMFASLAAEGAARPELLPATGAVPISAAADVPPPSWWRRLRIGRGGGRAGAMAPRSLPLREPGLHFIASLLVVLLSALALVAAWFVVSGYLAEVAYARGLRVLNTAGDVAAAQAEFHRARGWNPTEDRFDNALAQLGLIKLQSIIQRSAGGATPELQAEFRDTLTAGAAAAQAAAAANPSEPNNWLILGQLFETVVPFLSGADQASIDAYARARDQDPLNPALPFAQGRVHLTVADLAQLQAAQAQGQAQKRLFEARAQAIEQAKERLRASLELKPDYAQAHFLLAQLAIREDKLDEAISKTEETSRFAAADIGVAFQLGFLYYRANRLDEAKAEFERAVLLNDNYSNARYFLGLIYDRRGDRDAALSQFQKIAALNPGNEEVERIIGNLELGRPALAGIVPPAPAPEARREAPVKERGEDRKPLERR